IKFHNPVHAVAGRLVRLRRRGHGFVGPCPICSPDPAKRDSTRFECDTDRWVCAVCRDGGDVIRLVERVEGLGFVGAVERLGGTREIDPAAAARRQEESRAQWAAREAQAADTADQNRRRALRLWAEAVPIAGTVADSYLTSRGLVVRAADIDGTLRFH